MAKLVGIDLGTTYTAIATLDDRGQAVTLPNREGDMITPSVVFIDGDCAVVGQAARDVALEQPDKVAAFIKRRMGHKSYGRPVAGRDFRPETLSALILRKMKQDAELRIGPIDKAVITVPAYFDDTRRKATKDAGRIAGLDVLDIIDEPTAAALAYCFQPRPGVTQLSPDLMLPDKQQTVLVYDLGGGTFDVTLVRLSKRRFEAVAIEGDVLLGGKDWDDRIVDYVALEFKKKFHADPRDDPQSLSALSAAADRAKRTLSKTDADDDYLQPCRTRADRPPDTVAVRGPNSGFVDPHPSHRATSAAAGGNRLGQSRPRPDGRRLDPYADDREDA
ncbi:MAG: hypothetical protein KatS3mg105_2336 [Gemmatales bacterium]|nr:MAG: hypothetical protein KatS3mg105_2336 [Gemmatales bacterium]